MNFIDKLKKRSQVYWNSGDGKVSETEQDYYLVIDANTVKRVSCSSPHLGPTLLHTDPVTVPYTNRIKKGSRIPFWSTGGTGGSVTKVSSYCRIFASAFSPTSASKNAYARMHFFLPHDLIDGNNVKINFSIDCQGSSSSHYVYIRQGDNIDLDKITLKTWSSSESTFDWHSGPINTTGMNDPVIISILCTAYSDSYQWANADVHLNDFYVTHHILDQNEYYHVNLRAGSPRDYGGYKTWI